ncbi:MAG: type II secretion system F family protein [archaeon]
MIYEIFSNFVPAKVKQIFENELRYAGFNTDPVKFVGFLLIYSIALSLILSFIVGYLLNFDMLVLIPVFFLAFILIVYYVIGNVSDRRASYVEKILPDALHLIASNLKSGLTTERAFLISAREEFGPLAVELKNASKRIMTGEKTTDVLVDIPKTIKSKSLERNLGLLIQGISSGAQMSELLLKLGDELREQNTLEREAQANVSIYVMMIFITAAIGAPVLLGISSTIVGIFSSQTANIDMSNFAQQAAGSAIQITGLLGGTRTIIPTDFINLFSLVTLIVTGIFASLTLGVIQFGKEKAGIKYIPVIVVISVFLFFFVKELLDVAMKSLFLFV